MLDPAELYGNGAGSVNVALGTIDREQSRGRATMVISLVNGIGARPVGNMSNFRHKI